jgi:hypothetical protein
MQVNSREIIRTTITLSMRDLELLRYGKNFEVIDSRQIQKLNEATEIIIKVVS